MKAAVVTKAGTPPVYQDFNDPQPGPKKSVIRVTASALSHVSRSRATGEHYSSQGGSLFVPGVDGAGVTPAGERVYFCFPEFPFGGMAQSTLVDERHCVPLPQGLSDTLAAAIAIPGMSSWAALRERAQLLTGETVLINGATGASGRLAIQIAKHLGAGKVIATGRRVTDDLRALGADHVIPLADNGDILEATFKEVFRDGVDIVLDYLWGPSAETLMIAAAKAAPEGVPVRYVEIGSASAAKITLPSAALRSSSLLLMGSGIASVPFPKLLEAISGVLNATPVAGFKVATRTEPLSKIEELWDMADATERAVLVP